MLRPASLRPFATAQHPARDSLFLFFRKKETKTSWSKKLARAFVQLSGIRFAWALIRFSSSYFLSNDFYQETLVVKMK
jgi:hypothetical protein